ncbi:MAG: hypothetical protein Q8P51_03130, partial [Ignavibacteria bacterium]|nr:hypothetical protein [Ignavibacteria bacterium]
VYWVRGGGHERIIHYQNIITDYIQLSEKGRETAKMAIDELFTEDESLHLKQFLTKKYEIDENIWQAECLIEEVSLPLPSYALPISVSGYKSFSVEGTCPCNRLPFKVEGHYEVYNSRYRRRWANPTFERDSDYRYLRKALALLEVQETISDKEIREAVKSLVKEGLSTFKGKSNEEIVKEFRTRLDEQAKVHSQLEAKQVQYKALENAGFNLEELGKLFGKNLQRGDYGLICEFSNDKVDSLPF